MATATAVPEQQQPQMSGFARAFNVLFSPKATFEDIVRKPSWIVPIALLTIFSIGAGALISKKVDWASFIRAQSEKSAAFQQLSDDQKQQRVDIGAKFAPMAAWIFAVCGPILFAVILTLVYWAAFNVISGAQLRFGVPFGIVSHSFMPSIFATILLIVVLSMKSYGEVNPNTMLASNLAAYVPSDSPNWLISLGQSLDVFWIWTMALLVIGFKAANPRKISSASAFGTVFGLWAIYVLVKVGWASMM
ncbi:MAG TPA: YIP1 family protein [Chthoniobacterales bacterium]|nr:YIP1 family protein [Chthoniobacterales bacterium]